MHPHLFCTQQHESYIYQRTERARSGCVLRADQRAPSPAGCSGCGGLAAAAPGQVGRLHPSNARARGAQGENLRGHKAQSDYQVLAGWATTTAAAASGAHFGNSYRQLRVWDIPNCCTSRQSEGPPRLSHSVHLFQDISGLNFAVNLVQWI